MIKITKAAITNSGLLPLNTSEAVNHIPGKLKLTFSCMMDLSKFPLDSQVCTMEVASFSKTIEELSLEWKTMNPVIMGKGLRMPQFEIVKIAASDCQESFQIGNYSCLVAEFHLTRSVGFHLVQSYLPTILIVIISWVSFWMDVDSVPGRTTLGVTTLLAVSSQSSGIQSGLPQVSYVKAIDVWMGTCTGPARSHCLPWLRSLFSLSPSLSSRFAAAFSLDWGIRGDREVLSSWFSTSESGIPQSELWTGVSSGWTCVSSEWTSVSTFVFCALLEFTFVNYMWRKQPAGTKTPETLNGQTASKVTEDDQDSSISVSMKKCGLDKTAPVVGEPSPAASLLMKNKVRARRIDEMCRLFFPLVFGLFNLIYWSYYLS
uniref:Uncharacterized protein n=1 Tax=Timema douglasi TaxID=61478 RepID=A0A7R8Z4K0_TIMDO|nr:unnamed protein product [Timema douglasi]